MVAFAGKRQFMDICNIGRKGKQKLTRVDTGIQTDTPEVNVTPASYGTGCACSSGPGLHCWCKLHACAPSIAWPAALAL